MENFGSVALMPMKGTRFGGVACTRVPPVKARSTNCYSRESSGFVIETESYQAWPCQEHTHDLVLSNQLICFVQVNVQLKTKGALRVTAVYLHCHVRNFASCWCQIFTPEPTGFSDKYYNDVLVKQAPCVEDRCHMVKNFLLASFEQIT